ncbi:unnamed protein product, partial [Laminaria digitata]
MGINNETYFWCACSCSLSQIIASRVRKGDYHTLSAFESEVMLLFDNGREYNVEESQVHQ